MTTDEQLRKDNDRFHRELPEMRNQNKRLTGFLQVSGYAKRERDEKTRVAQSYTRKENE